MKGDREIANNKNQARKNKVKKCKQCSSDNRHTYLAPAANENIDAHEPREFKDPERNEKIKKRATSKRI